MNVEVAELCNPNLALKIRKSRRIVTGSSQTHDLWLEYRGEIEYKIEEAINNGSINPDEASRVMANAIGQDWDRPRNPR